MLSNNKGFSLIELMVVVAIIAILSTIAIPNYQSFQARARQKEGFAMLSSYYQAAHSSRAEYGFFPGDLAGTGFSTTGTLGYTVTVADNATPLPYGMTNWAGCISTDDAVSDGAACPPQFGAEWTDAQTGAVGATIGSIAVSAAPAAATATTFEARASGVILVKATVHDEYTMNEQKALTVVPGQDGINSN